MPAPTEDENVVVPLRLQPVVDRPRGWRGRSGSLVAVSLVGFVMIAVVLGRAVDVGPARPPALAVASATPAAAAQPTPRPASTPELAASPLPSRVVVGGHIPTERRLVYANGLQVLDLATGTLQPTAPPRYGQMLPIGHDQVVCACVLGGIAGGDTTVPPSLRFGRYDLTGTAIVEVNLLSLADVAPVPDMTDGFNVASALSPDRATLYVLTVARRPPVWSIELDEVDVATGRIAARTSLGRIPVDSAPRSSRASPSPSPTPVPDGSPPDGVYVWANTLSMAPNGRTMFASVQSSDLRAGVWAAQNREWMVQVRSGHPGTAIRLKPAATLTAEDWCIGSPTFLDSVTIVQVCAPGGPQSTGADYYVRRLTTAGESLGDLPITGMPIGGQYPATAVVDVATRAAFLWDPIRHAAARIALDDGSVMLSAVPDSMLPGRGQPYDSFRSVGFGTDPGMVISPDGARLYGLGILPDTTPAGRSTGIWVFDARTLNLLEHWEPRAHLVSVAVSSDGQFVYAAGVPGFDVDGNEASWPASVTVYDAVSGEIQVIYGSVSPDSWVTFPVWP